MMTPIHIAITGCGHGELDCFYRMCEVFEKKGKKIDLLIITGDFQAVRNQEDLGSMQCPIKYKHMMDFYKYYSGEKVAPILTIYIGGNHEASNYHKELPYGGWVAPNIYYMGLSNIIQYKGLKIAGLSGIYNSSDYNRGYYEKVPFNSSSREDCDARSSVYHYRQFEISKLLSYQQHINIMISHDWPSQIFQYGNVDELLKKKPFFQEEIENQCLGSYPLMSVLNKLQPDYWFASHLHVKYAAIYPHSEIEGKATRFLSLDKCVKRREFIQVIDIEIDDQFANDSHLYYDEEWLSIVKESHSSISTSPYQVTTPSIFIPTKENQQLIHSIKEKPSLLIPTTFERIAPIYEGNRTDGYEDCINSLSSIRGNNQMDDYLSMLELSHIITIPYKQDSLEQQNDPNEISLDDLYNVSF